jgi:LysR family hydrogen peroxide-inducible transcriptional activator
LEDGHCLTDHALAACKLEGLKSSASFQGTSLYTLLQMVAGGQGITFVPEMAMGTELLSSTEIALTPLADQGPHREIGLVWRNTYFRKEDLKLLAEKMKTLLGMK